ncbi:hypothetical protein NX722_27880 [Endozoicomonas gorgoniicola]|uniref:Uncharacterized protein n=1 Tax=Endozoicomonas gorgoniicola TaxID=1234144 RepID=A0ABT3N050_9GAMM|nr:hypothetical protein [Endozoicomonas gorgoniicola]MCW7554624.1 hypothetical protein [Endozoicomonas gorgoniicola]MCW7556385.1 hypothetical protein [Endozoicomonas gorgoniicola]
MLRTLGTGNIGNKDGLKLACIKVTPLLDNVITTWAGFATTTTFAGLFAIMLNVNFY